MNCTQEGIFVTTPTLIAVIFGSTDWGPLISMTICPTVPKTQSLCHGGSDKLQVALRANLGSHDEVPLHIVFENLTKGPKKPKICINVFHVGPHGKTRLNKANIIGDKPGDKLEITSNQSTNKKLYVGRKASAPKMTVEESLGPESKSSDGLSLEIEVYTDTDGDVVGWMRTVLLPRGGLGPGWPSKPDKGLKGDYAYAEGSDSDDYDRAYTSRSKRPKNSGVISKGVVSMGLFPELPEHFRIRPDVGAGEAGRVISKARLSEREGAAPVRTRPVSFEKRAGTTLNLEIVVQDLL